MGCKEDYCIGPIPFWWFITPFYATCLQKFWFFRTTYHSDSKPMPLDLAHLKPYIHATQVISMHFSLSKSTKCEIYACLLNSPLHKMKKKHQFEQEKVFQKAWKSAQTGFSVCQSQCTMSELCVTSTFSVMKVFLNFWQEGLGIGFWNMVYG